MKNPDIKLGMVSYLGFPINFPDNQPFGTLCVLDNKENLDQIGQKSIEVIKNSSYRMKDFIASLLEYMRIGTEKEKTEVDIIQLIEDLKTDLHDIIEKNKASVNYIGNSLKISAYKPNLIRLFS
jgi:light-regulated signal transduction histidine kinase (bacteriophytochrome)